MTGWGARLAIGGALQACRARPAVRPRWVWPVVRVTGAGALFGAAMWLLQ